MVEQKYFTLPESFLINLVGTDCVSVLNNLSTNEIVKLEMDGSCETFITNLRGWTVALANVYRKENGLLLIGQHPEPAQIIEHIDRYVIREDVDIQDMSSTLIPLIANESLASKAKAHFNDCLTLSTHIVQNGWLIVLPKDKLQAFRELAESSQAVVGSAAELDYLRIANFWPISGKEILEKTIPQELDRDDVAISFTKGCYLGQETIARLDARGQLQKKLCLLALSDSGPVEAGTHLVKQEKQVGTLTSIAQTADSTLALSFVKRGAFEVGQELHCGNGIATVVASQFKQSK